MNIPFEVGDRLDKALARAFPDYSRSYLSKLINTGYVLVNGVSTKTGWKLRADDSIEMTVELKELEKIEDIDLPVIYEDHNVLVVNKPNGIISHSRGKYWYEPSVASFLRQKTGTGEDRAGIVHRLDRATSGVMICAKNEATLSFLQKQFSERNVKKTYYAVISSPLPSTQGIIDMPIGRNPIKPQAFMCTADGKNAQTEFVIAGSNETHQLVELHPLTGRTHQLRVHLQYLKCPIVGDILYGGETHDRLLLHASSLEITLPGGKRTTFVAPLPNIFNLLTS